MTAYKNRKAALAVTAGLVGALTLGGAAVAVPAAYAETGATAQSDWATNAEVTEATNGKGQLVADAAKASFPAKDGQYLVPTKVVNQFGLEKALTNPANYTFLYSYKAAGTSNSWANVANIQKGDFTRADKFFSSDAAVAGTYRVTVWENTNPSARVSQTFTLTKPSVQGITVNDQLTFNGWTAWVDTDLDVKDVNNNQLALRDDYEISKVVDANGNTLHLNDDVTVGTYKVTVEGKGAYAGTKTTVTVTVNPLDLSKAEVTVLDVQKGMINSAYVSSNAYVSGYKGQFYKSFKVTSLIDPSGNNIVDSNSAKEGEYTATIKGTDANVIGEATVKFTNYDLSAGTLFYGEDAAPSATTIDGGQPIVVDKTKGDSWNESALAFRDANGNEYAAGATVTYYKGLQKVDASALEQPGTYTVLVKANTSTDSATSKLIGGFQAFSVRVLGAQVSASTNVAFVWNGEQANSGEATFDGTDQLKNLAVIVLNSKGDVLEQGKDYELTAKKDGHGDAATEAVNAGTYKVTVTPKTFEFKGNATFTLTVSQAKISELVDQTITYTGKELGTPAPQYSDAEGNPVPMADDFYKFVSIKNSKGKVVKAMKDAGDYTVTVALTDKANGNYDLVDVDYTVTVKKAISFADVAVDAWYADPINKAFDNGYVNGFAGTNLFGPERQITRADAVCILFNMAGGKDMSDDLFDRGPLGFETGFSDVAGNAYYAKALAWANEADVANGYSDGTFKPEAQITREEFAALLSNYAKLKGEYKAPTGDLSSFGDASSVSDWAKGAVAWAVENGVMGNGGFLAGQSHITRAEVAAMAVNYQPNPVKAPVYKD